MPIFEYECPRCRRRYECLVPLSSEDQTIHCDDCREPLELQFSRPASFPVGKYGKAGGLK